MSALPRIPLPDDVTDAEAFPEIARAIAHARLQAVIKEHGFSSPEHKRFVRLNGAHLS